jgi:FtsP/CotA-like multicopper oxidase with cupredoxin domain
VAKFSFLFRPKKSIRFTFIRSTSWFTPSTESRFENPVWLDTVNVSYGSSVDLVMDFTDPIIRGMSFFHCQLLNHEDKGMMAKILFR